jgi:hypothetical protein
VPWSGSGRCLAASLAVGVMDYSLPNCRDQAITRFDRWSRGGDIMPTVQNQGHATVPASAFTASSASAKESQFTPPKLR